MKSVARTGLVVLLLILAAEIRADPARGHDVVDIGFSQSLTGLGSLEIMSHDQLICGYNDAYTRWADVTVDTEVTDRAPILRLAVRPWKRLAFEAFVTWEKSELRMTLDDQYVADNSGGPITADPTRLRVDLGDDSFEYTNWGIRGIYYPTDAEWPRRWPLVPFLVAGIGVAHFTVETPYIEDVPARMSLHLGGGLQVLRSGPVGVRLECLYTRTTIDPRQVEYFAELDEGTRLVPVVEFVTDGGAVEERPADLDLETTIDNVTVALGISLVF